jgi:hypothetical protein
VTVFGRCICVSSLLVIRVSSLYSSDGFQDHSVKPLKHLTCDYQVDILSSISPGHLSNLIQSRGLRNRTDLAMTSSTDRTYVRRVDALGVSPAL